MSYLLVVFLLGFLILVHEAGHLIAARSVGIPVTRFSIGFGPKVCSWHRGKTEYRLSFIPLGGYVLPAIEDEEDYFKIPVIKRTVLALGGPVANLAFPFLLLSLLGAIRSGLSWSGILVEPALQTGSLFGQVLTSLPVLFTQPDQLSGVVGIIAQGGDFVGMDIQRISQFLIFLSINLAVLNLLPFPVLDGGKILLCLLEKVHPKMTKLHIPLSIAGWVIMIGLMVYVTVHDVGRLLT